MQLNKRIWQRAASFTLPFSKGDWEKKWAMPWAWAAVSSGSVRIWNCIPVPSLNWMENSFSSVKYICSILSASNRFAISGTMSVPFRQAYNVKAAS